MENIFFYEILHNISKLLLFVRIGGYQKEEKNIYIPVALIGSDKKVHGKSVDCLSQHWDRSKHLSLRKVSLNWWSTDLFALRSPRLPPLENSKAGAETINAYRYTHTHTYCESSIHDSPPTRNGGWKARLPICRGTGRISRREGCPCVRERTGHRVPNRRPRPPGSAIPIRDSSDPWTPALSPASSPASCPLRRRTSGCLSIYFC